MAGELDRHGLAALLRPRILFLVLVETAAGYLLEGEPGLGPLPWALAGTALVGAAGCVLNHYLERDVDRLMARTRLRPLVTGAMREAQVLGLGLILLLAGLGVLAAGCSPTTVALEAAAIAIYAGVYTPLKRRTSANTWVGAIPGALPLLAGAAAAGGPGRLAWIVAGLVFLWQIPHFFAIASLFREEYRAGGLRMLSGDDPDDALLRQQMPMQVMSVVLLSIVPVLYGPAGLIYGLTALGMGAMFLVAAFRFRRRPDRPAARKVVLASVAYLPLVLTVLVVDTAVERGAPSAVAPVVRAGARDGAPATLGTVPPFELVGDDGRPFRRADMAGASWVVDFIFTRCAGICIPMTQAMVDLQARDLPVRYLSVTVDPVYDTPQVLRAYRDRWGGDERWRLATGAAEAILALSEGGLKLPAGVTGGGVEGMPAPFHSGRFVLVDAQGHVRGTYDHADPADLDRLQRDVAALAGPRPPGEP